MNKLIIEEIKSSDSTVFLELILRNKNHLKAAFPKTIENITERNSCESFIQSKIESAKNNLGYYFVLKKEKVIIGVLSIRNINQIKKDAEIAYFIDKNNEGKGYISFGLKFLIDFSKKMLKLHSIYANVDDTNISSVNVLKRNLFELQNFDYNTSRLKYNLVLN